jgi:hypothetical protein
VPNRAILPWESSSSPSFARLEQSGRDKWPKEVVYQFMAYDDGSSCAAVGYLLLSGRDIAIEGVGCKRPI